MTDQELLALYKQAIEGEASLDEKDLARASRDASIFEMRPRIVVFPKHEKDVEAIVKTTSSLRAQGEAVSLTVRSAGTDMSGGALGASVIIDMERHFQGTLMINAHQDGGIARVLPGTYYRDFDKATRENGLIMPTYTASRDLCTVGGMVANNAGGEKSIHYGKTENFVDSLRVVLDDGTTHVFGKLSRPALEEKLKEAGREGNIYRSIYTLVTNHRGELAHAKPNVSKNSAGYYLWNVYDEASDTFDLTRIITGSQGTFGIITEITFRLVKVKPCSKLVVLFLNDLSYLGDLVNDIRAFDPESVESYDDNTLKIAAKFFRDFLKKRGPWGMVKFMVSFLPEFFMMLSGGVPKIILLVEIAGESEREIDTKALRMKKKLWDAYHSRRIHIHITHSDREEEKYWEVRHDSFALLRKHVHGVRTAPFIDDFIVRPEFLPQFIPELNAILGEYKLRYTIAGHPGDGNFHIIPLMDFKDPQTPEIIYRLSDRVYDLVMKYKGSITAEHNDGIIRTPYLEKMYGKAITELFAQTKRIWDPRSIFNPGKKVGGTKEDIKRYFIKDGETA